jgi:hypothetical protein
LLGRVRIAGSIFTSGKLSCLLRYFTRFGTLVEESEL